MIYVEKTLYLEVAPPGHAIAYKTIDNLLKVYVLICYIASKYDA